MNVPSVKGRGLGCALATLSALAVTATSFAGDSHAVLPPLKTVSVIASTVPGIGDVNPYGMAQVKRTTGNLRAGHILISNFNNSSNQQGTGTTIMDLAPDGSVGVFAQLNANSLPGGCPGGVGLTTALVVLDRGWVIVGSLPTSDGTSATAQAGCLIVLDSLGNAVETFFGSLINGPWDMTAFDGEHTAALFVTNVLNGTVAANGQVVHGGTVTRLDLEVSATAMPVLESITVIGSGFAERTDPAALVIGPTGVALSARCGGDGDADRDDCGKRGDDHDGTLLYVADTLNNRITVIDHALERTSSSGTGRTLSAGGTLNAPLGLIATPGGDLLTVNGADGNIIEIGPGGAQRAHLLIDSTGSPPGNGALFGLVFDPAHGVYFVDDVSNTLNLLH
jgi:hypothetical protein